MKDMNALRRNLRAVEETRQITNAMFLLSTSRMKRCQQQVAYNKTYIRRIRAAVKDILLKVPQQRGHAMFNAVPAPGAEAAYLVLASDKGMCGSYNTDVINKALSVIPDPLACQLEIAGLRGEELLREHGVAADVEWFIPPLEPDLYYARQIGEHLVQLYRSGAVSQVQVIYTEYESSVRQTVRVQRLLPLDIADFDNVESEYPYNADMLYEPDAPTVLEHLTVQYTVSMVHELINLALASEHCARRAAMQSATDNADGMLRSLSAAVNQARQLAITAEITEIAAAAELMEKAV